MSIDERLEALLRRQKQLEALRKASVPHHRDRQVDSENIRALASRAERRLADLERLPLDT
jgi:cob(I)alamin adenosyltransferase